MVKLIPVTICLAASLVCKSQPSIEFFNSDTVRLFGPGIISDGFSNRDMAISPDGKDLYYTLQWSYGLFSVILHSKKINGVWSKPETAWFSGRFNDLEPAFSPDGQRLFFTSNRRLHGMDSAKDYDIWYLQRNDGKWEGPFNAGDSINTDKDEFYPSLSRNGNLYFTRDNGDTKDDIFMAVLQNGKYKMPVRLPDAINSKGFDFNAFVDPDENFILFSSYKRDDDIGGGDLYYSLKKNSIWQPAMHFGKEINSSALDYSPFVSADKQYFFFTSKRQLVKFPFRESKTADQIREVLNSFGNGNDDIYMMNFKIVEEMMK
jgi:Tol biopolymer transport system component